jgi:hypothetical protein
VVSHSPIWLLVRLVELTNIRDLLVCLILARTLLGLWNELTRHQRINQTPIVRGQKNRLFADNRFSGSATVFPPLKFQHKKAYFKQN